MAERTTQVRKHPRRTKYGNLTTVRRHNRKLPERREFPNFDYMKTNKGEVHTDFESRIEHEWNARRFKELGAAVRWSFKNDMLTERQKTHLLELIKAHEKRINNEKLANAYLNGSYAETGNGQVISVGEPDAILKGTKGTQEWWQRRLEMDGGGGKIPSLKVHFYSTGKSYAMTPDSDHPDAPMFFQNGEHTMVFIPKTQLEKHPQWTKEMRRALSNNQYAVTDVEQLPDQRLYRFDVGEGASKTHNMSVIPGNLTMVMDKSLGKNQKIHVLDHDHPIIAEGDNGMIMVAPYVGPLTMGHSRAWGMA